MCYAIKFVGRKHFEDLFLLFYSSYHLHTLEMTKESKIMKEGTPKITNRLHIQERTKGNKIVVEKCNVEEHGGGGAGGVGF